MSNYISSTLKKLRAERGLTQKQLSESCGISLSSIINYENALREPNSKAMAILERYFKVSGDVLRGNTPLEYVEDTSENFDFFNEVLGYAVTDFKKKCDSVSIGKSEACDALATAYVIVKHLLNDLPESALAIKDFNELLTNYKVLTDDGKKEMLRRIVEFRQLEGFKNRKSNSCD